MGAGLLSLNVPAGQQSFIGIYSQNRPEWVITEQAVNAYSMVLVPLYDTLGIDAVKFIVNQAGIRVVVADPPKIKPLLKCLSECKTLELVIKIGEVCFISRANQKPLHTLTQASKNKQANEPTKKNAMNCTV